MRNKIQAILLASLLIAAGSCAEKVVHPDMTDQDLRIGFLHTTDIHSRLLPYRMNVGASDQKLGLRQENEPFGGIARIATVIERERGRGDRIQYVDSGDAFQGAPIFNAFHGEVEIKAMSQLRPDAMVVGNHEYDEGIHNYAEQLMKGVNFPVLAANYLFETTNPLKDLVKPVEIRNVDGLRVGYIGVANFSSLSSITDVGTSLELVPLDIVETVQHWIDILEPQCDLIVAISHAGLNIDEEMIKRTRGLDLVFGGHLHIVLNPPKVIKDASDPPRDVILAHSGAFAKYVGRLDVVVRNGDVINHKYEVFPIDSRIPDDPLMMEVLEPYQLKLNQMLDLTAVYGFAASHIRRFDFDGGDSPLGNLVAEAIRKHARADIGLMNSLGVRSDIFTGPITMDDLFNVFPFNNTITTIYLSGNDIQDLLDYTTRRSAGRGCATQVQLSGVEFTMNCNYPDDESTCEPNCPPRAENIFLTNCGDATLDAEEKELCSKKPLDPFQIYEVATNDYIAHGGSGFTVLKINNTQVNTGVQLRDSVLEEIVRADRCTADCTGENGELELATCEPYQACVEGMVNYLNQFCDHIHETTPGETAVPLHCAVDPGGCTILEDCYDRELDCTGGDCSLCTQTAECGEGEGCFKGVCVPADRACVAGRCRSLCEEDGDCGDAGGAISCVSQGLEVRYCAESKGQLCGSSTECADATLTCYGETRGCTADDQCPIGFSCADERCEPEAISCESNSDCAEVSVAINGEETATICTFGICRPDRDGACAGCEKNSDCSGTRECVSGHCLELTERCEDNRCRSLCSGGCEEGEACAGETCVPSVCTEPMDLESRCMMDNLFKAQAQCLQLPCPDAQSDGRIKRILPANLDELPEDLNPDDQEG